MVPISRAEKDILVKEFPPHTYPQYYSYPRTMKQDSKRKHYFCVESKELMKRLAQIRREKVVEVHKAWRR